MEFRSPEAARRYDALVAAASTAVVGLDFDGTLAPIVSDPGAARIHPDAAGTLVSLAAQVKAVAVITGRPARQVLALGDLDEIGRRIGDAGRELHVFGQYGYERWSSTDRRISSPRPPAQLSSFLEELPGLLRRSDATEAFCEDKGLAVAVHTRRLADADAAFERLLPELRASAEQHRLVVEPGRQVIEVRAPGMDKGRVVETIVEEMSAGAFLFAGDDLGDLEAFEAVARLRDDEMPTLLVCSGSDEERALADLADVVVAGPDGVLDLLRQLTADARSLRADRSR